MAFPTKAVLLGGAGCLTAGVIGFSQARSSLSIKEQLYLDGYILISEKEKIADKVWGERAKIYRDSSKNSEILLSDLPYGDVKDKGEEIKAKCEQFTDGKTTMKSIDKKIYEKIAKLCTLKISEYIESHFKEGDKFIQKTGEDDEWNGKFEKYQERITRDAKEVSKNNAKNELPKYCDKVYELQKSNKHSTETSNASDWCVKRKEPPASPDLKLSED